MLRPILPSRRSENTITSNIRAGIVPAPDQMNAGRTDFRPTQESDTNEHCRRPRQEVKPLSVCGLDLFIQGYSKARQLQRGSVLPSKRKQT